MNMIKLSVIVALTITTNTAFAALSTCLQDTQLTRSITHGSMIVTNYAYVSPNCINTCPCARYATSYRCTCDSGYYSTGGGETQCNCNNACPANSTCSSASSFSCNAGYYKNGSSCTKCPDGGTSDKGATDITQCYIASGASFSDTTGSGTYTSKCYYAK